MVHEEKSIAQRTGEGVPDAATVFSQARNGRIKRVEDSLNADFPIDEPDEKGNTLLLVGAQNCNKKLIELTLNRGAKINHQNATGNTALHFAMAYDTEVSCCFDRVSSVSQSVSQSVSRAVAMLAMMTVMLTF